MFIRLRKIYFHWINQTDSNLVSIDEVEVAELFSISEAIKFEIRRCNEVKDEKLGFEILCTLYTELLFLDVVFESATARSVLNFSPYDSEGAEFANMYLSTLDRIYDWKVNGLRATPLRVLYSVWALLRKIDVGLIVSETFSNIKRSDIRNELIAKNTSWLPSDVDIWLVKKVTERAPLDI